ncbi:glycosyltransferase [Urechidicola vernalis]|uniref:Glycosyltransferase n=1 Tax=Urechidicola vernalis TaxID=3075600 RepID=A0ABU2Y7I3_9FLAO|nr:glycosyltransferase [Urechidicola sp. P050]MDT0554169.1 glycosyltransferase [Urechidicola sp. P050]
MESSTIKLGKKEGNILVAPLNWGLGHATRCIPIIIQLQNQGFNPILASDGDSLLMLQKEFPLLDSINLPSYGISYPKNGTFLKLKLLIRLPKVIKTIIKEKQVVSQLIRDKNIIGVISDNRIGVRNKGIPSIYITHQINVLAGIFTFFTSRVHQYYMKKFDECWVPDVAGEFGISGLLSKNESNRKIRKIGLLSRLKKRKIEIKYDLLILLSGIEPQRSQLENKLIEEVKNFNGSALFVRGSINSETSFKDSKKIIYKNFLKSDELEKAIAQSKIVLARSGYSTIMDLAIMSKRAFFIPTKGQNEQEYLAKHLEAISIAPYATEEKFEIQMLENMKYYSGFIHDFNTEFPKTLFNLFHRK